MKPVVPIEVIEKKILLISGQKAMLDSDLAELYGVETKMLVRAVKRNRERFPNDFMVQLTKEEFDNLRRHFGTSRWGGRRTLPYAFTENGIEML
jgi:ORF6N domain